MGMVAHNCHPSRGGRGRSLRSSTVTEWIPGQPELHDTLSPKKQTNIKFHHPNIKKTSQSKLNSKLQEGEPHLESVKVRNN